MPALLCLGHGYSARALSRLLSAEGWRVSGTVRDAAGAEAARASGAEPLPWPLANARAALAAFDHVLVSIAPDADGDPVLRAMGEALTEAAPRLRWIGYLSTTAVYGDRGGAWIDESAERRPVTERGRWRVAAEDAWLDLWRETGAPVHLFRLAGIYGPGRGPLAKVRSGAARRIVKAGQVFSRIHVEDLARILRASIARPHPGRAYNVADDEPAPPEEVIAEAARLLGLPPPPAVPFEEADLSPMARSFYGESKRPSNARIKAELGVRLACPTWREGLRAILAAEKAG